MRCGDCESYTLAKWHCHRFPQTVDKLPDDWCQEFLESPEARLVRESEGRAKDAKVEQENIDKNYDERQAQKDESWPPAKELEKEVVPWVVEEKKVEEKAKVAKAKASEPAHKGRFHKR